MASATIKIFLANGDAKRLRTAELSNWTGKAVAGPRSELEALLARDEAAKAGVYFLTGTDTESGRPAVYVGEAEVVRERLKNHLTKDFWNHAIFFISKDENLTKAHIRYLEGRLIVQAREAARTQVQNSQASGAKLPESDREDMEIFLEKIHQLLPVLGGDFLQMVIEPESQRQNELFCKVKGHEASGTPTPSGFIVFARSQAVLKERKSANKQPWIGKMRQTLLEQGNLQQEGDKLVFCKDTEFMSASTAATVIHGGPSNGLELWKNKDGKTLKTLEEAKV